MACGSILANYMLKTEWEKLFLQLKYKVTLLDRYFI